MTILYYILLGILGVIALLVVVYMLARLVTLAHYNSKKQFIKSFFTKFKKEMSEL